MAALRPVDPVRHICGLISSRPDLLDAAQARLTAWFGPVDVESGSLPFNFTDYYEREMGPGLIRRFIAFERLISPADIAGIKRRTNELEEEYAGGAGRPRPINLDPGYVAPGKLVLATTKDFAHRIYLQDGIYAEVTLQFMKAGIKTFDWTYPDFKSGRYTPFLDEVRRRLLAGRATAVPPAG